MSRSSSAAEAARLAALYRYEILDTPIEREFDDFARLAAQICGTPVALISFVDRDRQWFKSVLGLEIRETPLEHSICKHVVRSGDSLTIPDTHLDPRFRDNPLVHGDPNLRFYAGAPLATPAGEALGALCVLDFQPREITAEQRDALITLARKVMDTLELRSSRKVLHDTITSITDAFLILDDKLRIIHLNDGARDLFDIDRPPEELAGTKFAFEGDDEFIKEIREAVAANLDANFEFQHQPGGRQLAVRVYPARNGATVSCRDITDRKRIEKERSELMYDLDQRVRELGTLHQVADLLRDDAHTPEVLLERITALIPAAMRFPEAASAKLCFEDTAITGPGFDPEARWSIKSVFTTRYGSSGSVQVAYGDLPDFDNDPILEEERTLINSLAEMLRTHFDRLKTTASLLASEERFRRTFQDAATGIAITTPEGRFLETNEAFRRMLGHSEDELRQLDARSITEPEDWPASEKLLRELQAGKRGSFVIEKRYRHASGRIVWVRLSVSAIRAEGEEQLLIGVAEDISQRKQAESSLAASEKRFRQLAESMPIVVWTATSTGEVDYASPLFYKYCGIAASDSIGEAWMKFLHPADRLLCLAAWQDSIATGEPYQIEYRVRGADDGDYRWFRVQARPIRDDQGNIARWFGTGIDVHENRQLQEDASQLARSLTATLESITDAFITIDRNWKVTYLNSEAELQLEISAGQLLGQDLKKKLARRAGPKFRRELRRAMTENVTIAFEETFPDLGKWFDVRIYPSVEGLAIYLRNVTEAHRNREAIAVSEERFRLLSQATNDVIWDWDITTGNVWWNEGLATLFGYHPSEAPPTTANAWLDWEECIHPLDRERVTAGIKTLLEGCGMSWSDEYRFRRQDGSYAHVHYRCRLIRDPDGKAIRMIGGISDITDRKRSEDKLREQATLLDKAQDAIIVRDLSHRILYWNRSAERLYGWASAEVEGRSIEDLLYRHPTDFLAATEATLIHGEWVGELLQYTRSGECVTIEGRWSLVRDDDGEPRSILAINTDITDRKRLEQQFLRAQRMEGIGTLAGGIAHDLNNVLAPILMSIDLLKQTIQDQSDREVLDSIATSARRGAEMIGQVLAFARGTEGQRLEVDPRRLVDDMTKIIRDTFPKNIHVEKHVARDIRSLRADPTQLHQVLLNLCVNARDAMPAGGTIHIRLSNLAIDSHFAAMNVDARVGPYVLLEVEDQGEGIPAEVIDKIFDPFFTTKEVGAGTGLGLSTSLGIVKSHEGFIRVYSDPGIGTRFLIYLPASAESGDSLEFEAGKSAPRGKGETVLLVEDDLAVRQITCRTLETFGYQVLTASDGAEGFSTFAKNQDRIDLILTDIMMPVMDGLAMIKAIRKIDPAIKVIAASGIAAHGQSIKRNHPEIGCFLPKPYPAAQLLESLRQVLDR